MLISRKKYDEMFRGLLHKEQKLEDLRAALQDRAIEIAQLKKEILRQKQEIRTLNASLDATTAELERTKNTLAVSERERKQMLKERKVIVRGH